MLCFKQLKMSKNELTQLSLTIFNMANLLIIMCINHALQ